MNPTRFLPLLLAVAWTGASGAPTRVAAAPSTPPTAPQADGSPAPATSEDPAAPAETPSPEAVRQLNVARSLRYQQGEISLGNNLAKVALSPRFRFLGPDDAEKVLVQLWGNPANPDRPLGMIMPVDVEPYQERSWAVVIRYDKEGHVSDADAEKINYDELLKKMQQEVREESGRRVKEGYSAIALVGWAAPPRYDRPNRKLYWAKELRIGENNDEHTLNYNVRVLGREGVLVLNGIAGMSQFQQLEGLTPEILAMVDFNPGNRYADFNAKTDRTAAYGIAALVAGGVAAKVGLFKGLWLLLIGAKKFVLIALVALGSAVKGLWNRLTGNRPSNPAG